MKYTFLEFDEQTIKHKSINNQWGIECEECSALLPSTKSEIRGAKYQHEIDLVIMKQLIEIIEMQNEALKKVLPALRYALEDTTDEYYNNVKTEFESTLATVENKLKELK